MFPDRSEGAFPFEATFAFALRDLNVTFWRSGRQREGGERMAITFFRPPTPAAIFDSHLIKILTRAVTRAAPDVVRPILS